MSEQSMLIFNILDLFHNFVELINKNNPDIKFSFSKYFATGDIIEGTSNIEEIDDREGPITEHY